SKLLHCTMLAFAIFTPPAICDLESQNKSVPFALITVRGLAESAVAVERLTTTKPPWMLPVMLEPSSSAWELLLTITPWPWLPDTIRLGPAPRVDPLLTKTAPLLPPHTCPALLMRSLALPILSEEPSLKMAPLKFVPEGLSMITSLPPAVGSKLTKSTTP